MTEVDSKTIDQMFAFNLWANLEVLNMCQDLDDTQLSFEVDGAYGGIRSFLTHIVDAENYYITCLTGSPLFAEDVSWENLSIDTIRERAQLTGQRLIDIASKTDPDVDHERILFGKPLTFTNWMVLLQAYLHGVEHRTHVKVLLTHLGIEHHDISLWDYMATLQ